MNEPTMDNVVLRLDRLERENHRLKRMGALVLVVIAAFLLIGQAQPRKVAKVVEAEKFVLRSGKDGTTLAELKADPQSKDVGLYLYDFAGYERVELRVSGFLGPALLLKEENGAPSTSLGNFMGRSLRLYDFSLRSAAVLRADGDLSLHGNSTIELSDPKGSQRVSLHVTTNGGVLSLFGPKSSAILTTEGDTVQLNMDSYKQTKFERIKKRDFAKTGMRDNSSITLFTQSSNGSNITLSDANGKSRAVLGSTSLEATQTGAVTKRAESSLVLFDKKGKVIWIAP